MAKTSIKIGDKDYPYRLDFRAIRMAEGLIGGGVTDRETMWPRITFWMTVLWAGINRENSTVSFADIEKAVDKAVGKKQMTFAEVQEFAMRQLLDSGALTGFGDDDKEEDEDAAPLASANKSTDD